MRVIDADALNAEVDESISSLAFTSPYQDEIERVRDGMERVRNYIDNAPTIDAVEVVRCKDCQRFRSNTNLPIGMCSRFDTVMRYGDFCSYGERRDVE